MGASQPIRSGPWTGLRGLTRAAAPGQRSDSLPGVPGRTSGLTAGQMAECGAERGGALQPSAYVLVVDDEAIILMGFQAMLESWGHAVAAARTLPEALAVISRRGRPPKAMLVDYRLSRGGTGTSLVEAAEAVHGGRIPTLILTGDTSADCTAAVQARGYRLLHKPVSAAQLRNALDDLLKPVALPVVAE